MKTSIPVILKITEISKHVSFFDFNDIDIDEEEENNDTSKTES